MTIKKLLISNRGEIASRIIKSAHDMGITCVAIYTEADKNTPYVREADQSFKLSDSYLNAKEILEIAKKNNVDAIHPGYGFLSENANFANNVKKAGIKWVGPSANAIKKMGDKITAKTLAEKAGVPTYLQVLQLKMQTKLVILSLLKLPQEVVVKVCVLSKVQRI